MEAYDHHARSVRSSSQSISNSANARLCGLGPVLADPVGSLGVGEHEDVEQFGAGSWAKGIQTLPQSALKLVGSHGSSLRRREDCPRRRIYGRVTVSRAGAFDGRYPWGDHAAYLWEGEDMGCLLVLLSAFAPRLIVVFAWIARPTYFDAVFDTWIFPLLGLIFLPFTTLIWLLVGAPPQGVQGLDWLWVGLAVLLDLSHYANTYEQRGTVSAGMGRDTGAPPPPPQV